MKNLTVLFSFFFTAYLSAFGQSEMQAISNCDNFNHFLRSESINALSQLVKRVDDHGAIYFKDHTTQAVTSVEELYVFLGISEDDYFEFVNETTSRFDEDKIYRRYQQFYKGIKVNGGGYTEALFRSDGPPNNPCFGTSMINPFIYSGINVSPNPQINKADISNYITNEVLSAELVIENNISALCEYALCWKVTTQEEEKKTIWLDAHSGEILHSFSSELHLTAPTPTYGVQNLDDLTNNGLTRLISLDERIHTFDFLDAECPASYFRPEDWPSDLIPNTSAIEWTIEALPYVYQAFYATSQVLPAFDQLDIIFENVFVGVCDKPSASALSSSRLENSYIKLGIREGVSMALFDIVGHELAHCYLLDHIDYSSLSTAALHEGLSDILGTYVESIVQGEIDWEMGDDEEVFGIRNLQYPARQCYNDPSVVWPHDRGEVLGHWFYTLSQGSPADGIQALGTETVLNLLLETLPLIHYSVDFPQFMRANLIVAQSQYGRCSSEFRSIVTAWEYICVDTGIDINSDPSCAYQISGPAWVCEESEYAKFCIDGGPANADYVWTIIGAGSTNYESVIGMNGNSQNGGDCLTLINFPKYPYYPRYITIKAYSPSLGSFYNTEKRLKLIDCDNDDPTCEEYYNNFRPANSLQLSINETPTESDKEESLLFPNPSSSSFSILVGDSSFFLEIYSVTGQLIEKMPGSEVLAKPISVLDWPKGIYMLKVINSLSGNFEYHRLIVQ